MGHHHLIHHHHYYPIHHHHVSIKNLIIFNSLPFFKPLLDFIQCTMLTRMKRPITSLDFCYSGESETVSVQVFHQNLLQDFRKRVKNSKFQECVSICAMVAAYDSGTTRANEMLTVLDAILPLFLKQIVQDKKTEVTVLLCLFFLNGYLKSNLYIGRLL